MSGPRNYSAGTRAALATLSKGHCYYPNCHEPTIVFVNGEPIINYQIAHIKDANAGNRYESNMTDEQRASFENLVLLCKPHHTYVDKTKPEDFPSHVLQGWKDDREAPGVAELRGLDGLTEERLAELIHDAVAGGRGSAAELDWSLEEDEFESLVAELFRDSDDIAIRRFLGRAAEAWRTQVALPEGSASELTTILDHLVCLAAYAVRWDRREWAVHALATLELMYDAVLAEHGAVRADLVEPGHQLLAAIINRVLGLGTVILDEQAWDLLPELVLRRPKHLHSMYTNWVRHTTTSFSRATDLKHTDPATGKATKMVYLEHTLIDIGGIRCLNSQAPDTGDLRTRVAGVDALATLTVWSHAPGDRDHPYFPSHRAYEAFRYEAAIVLLLTDPVLRDVVFPGSDEDLAGLLLELEVFGIQQMREFGGGDRYTDPTIQRFVAKERARREHTHLLETVIDHARATGTALPLSRRGRSPVRVTYTDGSVLEFAGDLENYRRLVNAREVNHLTASPGAPPTTVDLWDNERLQAWLDENGG